jgi:hypothetical protein
MITRRVFVRSLTGGLLAAPLAASWAIATPYVPGSFNALTAQRNIASALSVSLTLKSP